MIKKILTYPENKQILSQVSEDANWEECQELIQDLKDTLKEHPDGVGISAIQIGVPKRVCYIKYAGSEMVMINPVITWTRHGTQAFKEGCLSVPGVSAEVNRPQKVVCTYTDEFGNSKEFAEGGWASAIVQHELDHFEGKCAVYDNEEL